MKRLAKRLLLITGICFTSLMPGCISGGVGSADFSLDKFFSNPLVIVAVLVLIIYLWAKGGKK